MNQYSQNKIKGPGTGPEFKKELDFYVPIGAILIELKDCYDDVPGAEPGSGPERIERKTLLLSKDYEELKRYLEVTY